jgi:starvation-inducible DNA-binding protein
MNEVRIVEPRSPDIATKDRARIAGLLGVYLTRTYELLLSTQLVHWNARGRLFLPVHQLTETHYRVLIETLDTIAERMRALGTDVPVSSDTKEFSVSTKLIHSDITEMVRQLAVMHETGAAFARNISAKSDEADDIVTTDMLVQCMAFHEKAVWMLEAIITK